MRTWRIDGEGSLRVRRNFTAFLSGRGRVAIRSGRIEVFGAIREANASFPVRLGRQVPAFARDEDVSLDLVGRVRYFISKGDPIPESWRSVPDLFLMKTSPKVMITGPVDSGKTSICTYLANTALNLSSRIALVDADLGQGDIGPPGCVAVGMPSKQFTDLRSVKPIYVGFLGATSPSLDIEGSIREIQTSVSLAGSIGFDYLFLNTDGWVDSEGLEHKKSIAGSIRPDVVVFTGTRDGLGASEKYLGERVVVVEQPPNIMRRDAGVRARIRSANFMRYFRGTELVVVSKNKVVDMGSHQPEEGTIVGLFKSDSFMGLGLFEGWSDNDSLRVYTNIRSFDHVKIGKSTVPMVLDLLRRKKEEARKSAP